MSFATFDYMIVIVGIENKKEVIVDRIFLTDLKTCIHHTFGEHNLQYGIL